MGTNPSQDSDTNQSTATDTNATQAQLTTILSSVDNTATQGVQNLQRVHQARLSQQNRTAAALTAKYGASDPRAQSAQAAVTASTTTVARIAMVQQQITTAPPQVSAGGWALHGRVFDSKLQPAAGYTVFLVDETNTYQPAYGFSYSDDTGYFIINYPGAAASDPQKSSKGKTKGKTKDQTTAQTDSTPAPSSATQSSGQSSGQSSAQTSAKLFLGIADANAQPVYLSTTAFQPVTGGATYQNVIPPAGGKPIGDPPAEVRSVAMPSQQKKS